MLAAVEGVSVIGTGPGEGHAERDDWISTYEQMMQGEMAGTRLEGDNPRAYEQNSIGWGVDQPSFALAAAGR